MTFKDFAGSLGITTEGKVEGNNYVVILKDSDDYAHHYTLLSNSSILELEEVDSVDEEGINLSYLGKNYNVVLGADFDRDEYKIIIKKSVGESKEDNDG